MLRSNIAGSCLERYYRTHVNGDTRIKAMVGSMGMSVEKRNITVKKVLVCILACLLLLSACGQSKAQSAAPPAAPHRATPTATSAPLLGPPTPVPTPQHTPSYLRITHGPAVLGVSVSNFFGKYGATGN